MRRLSIALAALALLCAFSASWKPFKNEKGNFSVMMPSTPKEEPWTEKTDFGRIEFYKVSAVVERKAYYVIYNDLPPATWNGDVKNRLQGARDGTVKGLHGILVDDLEIMVAGKYPGREFKVMVIGEKEMRQRVFLVKHRLYQLNMTCVLGECSDAEMQEYLDSFKLLREP